MGFDGPARRARQRWSSPDAARTSRERGSELVSYVLVQGLVLLVVLALLQLGFALHTRNLAISAASEGARRGGLLGGSEAEAAARTRDLLSDLAGAQDPVVSTSKRVIGGREVLVVTARTRIPVLASFGPRWLTVTGSSIVEEER